MLPVGLKDDIGVDTVKIFCPKCQSVYHPPPTRSRSGHHSSNSGGGSAVDGAAFGTTFPHLFLMTFNNLVPDPLPPDSAYIPRVFGFRVHLSARQQGIAAGVGSSALISASALTNNGRKGGGALAEFSPQRVVNMISTAAGSAVVDTTLHIGNANHEPSTRAGKDTAPEERADKSTSTAAVEADNLSAQQTGEKTKAPSATTSKPTSKKSDDAHEDGVVDGDGVKEKASANDGGDANSNSSKRKGKSDGGKNSGSSNENGAPKSRSSKRQKRSWNGAEVT